MSRALDASDVAADETYWREIQQAFTLDRTIINLNNGGCSPEPARRARGLQALSRHLEPGARLPHVANPRAEHRERAAAAGGRIRLRSGRARHHPQRQRGAADRAARDRSQAGRRGRDDEPGLRPDARRRGISACDATASASSRSRFRCRRRRWTTWRLDCSARSLPRRRCCTSATSRT